MSHGDDNTEDISNSAKKFNKPNIEHVDLDIWQNILVNVDVFFLDFHLHLKRSLLKYKRYLTALCYLRL